MAHDDYTLAKGRKGNFRKLIDSLGDYFAPVNGGGGNHSHGNFSLLETYTQTEASLADSVAKKHNTHAISDVSGLQTALDGKSGTAHNHDASYAGLTHNHDSAYSPVGHTHGYQPLDADLTAIAGLTAAGGWAKRTAGDTWDISTPTATDVGADPTGTASSAVAAHAAAADPHTGYQLESEKGTANGYAGLDASSDVPIANIPTGTTASTVCVGNDSRLSDARTPTGAASGQLGGTYPSPDVRGIRESGGQLLALGAVADGQYLQRSGTTLVGNTPAGGGGSSEPWEGVLHIAWGDGNPSMDEAYFGFQNTVLSVAGPTPTGITATIGRLVQFRFKSAITVANLRVFGVGAVSNLYRLAVYDAVSGNRLLWLNPMNVAVGWNAYAAGGLVLAANTRYWLGLATSSTGTTSGFRSPASPIANSLGVTTIPGNLANFGTRFAQVALTAGAWPATLPALAAAAFASAGTTGTLPIVFLDSA